MEKTAFILYLSSVVIGVLLFGAGHTYVYTLVFLLILLASLFQLKSVIRKNPLTGEVQFHWIKTGMGPLFYLMTAFLVLQLLPLPQELVKIISPEAWVMAQKAVPAQEAVANPSAVPGWITLAPYAYPVRMTLVRWLCYGLFFWGMVTSLNSKRRIDAAILVLICLGCFEVIYGLFQTFSGVYHIWWWGKSGSSRFWVSGTYISRNLFAGLLEMLLPLAAGAAIGIGVAKKPTVRFGRQSLRGKLTGFFQRGEGFNKRIFYLFTGVVIGIGLIFSGSRGGMIASACGLLMMGCMLLSKKGQRGKGGLILILFIIIGGWALRIGIEAPMERFEHLEAHSKSRERYSQQTMNLWQDYLWGGVGAGSFPYAYIKYQAAEDRKGSLLYAHNDWAQLLSEFGVSGAVIGVGGLLYFLARYLRMWFRRRDSSAIGIGLGCLAGVVAMGVHSFFDFNLHFPSNFLVMTALLAIGLAAIRLSTRGGSEKSSVSKRLLPVERSGMVFIAAIVLMVVWSGFWSVCHFMAEAYCNTVPNSTLVRDQLPPVDRIDKAIAWDPGNAEYGYKKSLSIIRDRDDALMALPTGWQLSAGDRFGFQSRIIGAVELAVALSPFVADYHLRNGWEYTGLWHQPEYHKTYLPAADIAMERAAYTAGVQAPRLHVEMGKYWTMRSKMLDPSDPRWEPAWNRAGYHFRKALSMELVKSTGVGGGLDKNQQQLLLKEIRDFVWAFYPDLSFLQEAMGEYYSRLPNS